MFHLPKSSRSSDENLQINLLKDKDRQSRVNIVRVNHKPMQGSIQARNIKRRSQRLVRQNQFNQDIQANTYDNYSAFGAEKIDFSQSLLTNTSDSNSFVGVILFILLVVFTPLQTVSLNASQEMIGLDTNRQILIFLIVCQLVALTVLYYFRYVQSITILGKYLKLNRKNHSEGITVVSKIIIRPYLLFFIIICLTVVWELSYSQAILQHDQISHLMLFYVIILPQIACSLYFQQEMQNHTNLKILFYMTLLYLAIIGFLTNPYLLCCGATGTLLVYFSIRAGRMCIFMEYITKLAILIVVIVLQIADPPYEESNYIPDIIDDGNAYNSTYPIIVLLVCACSVSIILVRCINNKVLRVELYKYFYSDASINIVILFLPFVMGFLQLRIFDIFVGVIGCTILIAINYKIDKYKQMITIDFNNTYQDQSPRK